MLYYENVVVNVSRLVWELIKRRLDSHPMDGSEEYLRADGSSK